MKARIAYIALFLILMAAPSALRAQEYTQTPVTVSKEKVRSGGKVFYSHVVQEKQTLFSIARAYGVSVDDICAANPSSNLKEEGLRVHAIILIPTEPSAGTSIEDIPEAPSEDPIRQDYFIHNVKWYEDIDDISKKYGISADYILKYNGLTSPKLKSRMKLRIPYEEKELVPVGTDEVAEAPEAPADSLAAAPADTSSSGGLDELLAIFRKKDKVDALLVLPFAVGANSSSTNAMDFYSGFLMGVKELGQKGINIDLGVYDVAGGNIPVGASQIASSDIVIGPVTPSDLKKVLAMDSDGTTIVSPLDPMVADLVSDYPDLVHAPTPSEVQYEDAVKWIAEDMASDDKVIVISERGERNADTVAMVDSLLRDTGVNYMHFDYNLLAGRRVADELEKSAAEGTTRVILTSDSEAFVHDVVRNLGLLLRKHKVVLYGVSKIRTFSTIEVENLHKLNLHAATSYFIDYDEARVRDFVMAYRALFNSEPSQFAFQGHDIAVFFLAQCKEGGPRWKNRLDSIPRESLLQTDYLFSKVEEGGLVNTAIRRVVYTPDYHLVLVK